MTSVPREGVADSVPTSRCCWRMGQIFASMVVGVAFLLGGSVAMAQLPPAPPATGLASPAAPPPAVDAPLAAPEPEVPPAPPMPADMMAPPAAAPPPVVVPALPAPSPSAMYEEPSRLTSCLLWAAGGASLVVGAAFGIAAISAKSDFDDKPTFALADSVHSRAIISDVGFGLGLILAATGTVFYFSGESESSTQHALNSHARQRPRLGAAPLVGRGTGGGLVTVQF